MDAQTFISICKREAITLPVSHYLGRKIEVNFDASTQTSYYDGNKIVVSFQNILSAIANKFNKSLAIALNVLTENDIEMLVRPLLYHELSHTILSNFDFLFNTQTGCKLFDGTTITQAIVNIIEDERIETLLKHYYRNVDFKQNLYNICGDVQKVRNTPTNDFETFVFKAVRYRLCSKIVNDKINEYIKKTKNLNARWQGKMMNYYLGCFLDFVNFLYKEFLNQQKQNQQQQNQQQNQQDGKNSQDGNSNENESENQQNTSQSSTENESEDENETQNEGESENQNEDENSNEEDQSNEETTSNENNVEQQSDETDDELTMDEVFKTSNSINNPLSVGSIKQYSIVNETLADFQKIIAKHCGYGIDEASVDYGYSGKFSIKRYINDFSNECKWFERINDEDTFSGRNNEMKIINIFLDNSGSFDYHDNKVNEILRALVELEKRYETFKFNLCRWGDDYFIEEGDKRFSQSNMGTRLDEKTFPKIVNKLNQTGNEVNIFLTDGAITYKDELYCPRKTFFPSSPSDLPHIQNIFRPLNNNKTIVISYDQNKPLFDVVLNKTTRIYVSSGEYSNKLKDNICKALNIIW